MTTNDPSHRPLALEPALSQGVHLIAEVDRWLSRATAASLREAYPDAPPEAVDLVLALAELEAFDGRAEDDDEPTEAEVEKVLARVNDAVDRLAAWPPLARVELLAAAPAALERAEMAWLGPAMLASVPLPGDGPWDNQAFRARALEALDAQVRLCIGGDVWDPTFDEVLAELRVLATAYPDDRRLGALLADALEFHAISGWHERLGLLRGRELAAQALAATDEQALAQLAETLELTELAATGLRLLAQDLRQSGALADVPAQHLALATVALAEEVDEVDLDIDSARVWAAASERTTRDLLERARAVLGWSPDGEAPARRQGRRWRLDFNDAGILPSRFGDPSAARVPYSPAAAAERMEQLREIAWLMVDAEEAPRFVAEGFALAPGEDLEPAVAAQALAVWGEEQLEAGLAGDEVEQ